jgi:hypothetical protein
MNTDAWGSHYWFFLHSVARNYPPHPTAIHRKIHYRLIMNFHEFIPHAACANSFSSILKDNPVSPYLDSRRDFMIWTNHIHNLINAKLEKENVPFSQFAKDFEVNYAPTQFKARNDTKFIISTLFMALLVIVALCIN